MSEFSEALYRVVRFLGRFFADTVALMLLSFVAGAVLTGALIRSPNAAKKIDLDGRADPVSIVLGIDKKFFEKIEFARLKDAYRLILKSAANDFGCVLFDRISVAGRDDSKIFLALTDVTQGSVASFLSSDLLRKRGEFLQKLAFDQIRSSRRDIDDQSGIQIAVRSSRGSLPRCFDEGQVLYAGRD